MRSPSTPWVTGGAEPRIASLKAVIGLLVSVTGQLGGALAHATAPERTRSAEARRMVRVMVLASVPWLPGTIQLRFRGDFTAYHDQPQHAARGVVGNGAAEPVEPRLVQPDARPSV